MTQGLAAQRQAAAPVSRPRLTLSSLWAFASIALPVVASLEASLSSVDLAYQIRAGNVMLHTHHLIRSDTFSFTAAGRGWLDQQWASQLVFAGLFRAGGWALLALFRAALVGVIFFLVYRACRVQGANERTAAALTLAAFGVSVGGLALRPQLLGMALFAAAFYVTAIKRRSPKAMWWLVPIVAVWANLHGSFFLGPMLAGLAFLEDARERAPGARSTLLVAIASGAAATLNPFGLRVWSYTLDISTNRVITRFISEWQPPSVREIAGATFFVSVLAVAVLLARRGRPTPWPTLVTLGVFLVIGLTAVRGIFWWALAVPPALTPAITEMLGRRRQPRDARGGPVLNFAFVGAIVLLGLVFLPWWRGHSRALPSEALVSEAPTGVTVQLRSVLRPGDRIFNPQIWGSWFELAFPRNPIFVDSRIEVFPTSVWRDYQDVSSGHEGWQAVLARWGVEVVVASRQQQSSLIPRIRRDPGWTLVHQDRLGLVFVRR